MYGLSRRRISGAAPAANLLGALLLVLQAACAARTTGAAALPDREFVGHLITMERGNWFRPCETGSSDSLLWVTFTDESVGQIERARSEGMALVGDTAFVRWRAAPTDERMVGPGGPALLVRDIAEVRPAGERDCETESAVGRGDPARGGPFR